MTTGALAPAVNDHRGTCTRVGLTLQPHALLCLAVNDHRVTLTTAPVHVVAYFWDVCQVVKWNADHRVC